MSYVGHIQGDIYSHCWFYESARRALKYDGFGETCGGLTVITLTAFMLESYINLSCKMIFDISSRIEAILDGKLANEIIEKIEPMDKTLDFNERISHSYGFQSQLDLLILKISEQLKNKTRKDTFNKICLNSSFYDIDDQIRLSPKVKFIALSQTLYNDEEKIERDNEIFEKIFHLRNMLAHGRSEFSKKTVRISEDKVFSTQDIPTLQAKWQEECTLAKAEELFNRACEIVNFISNIAFSNDSPFRMPTQIATMSKG